MAKVRIGVAIGRRAARLVAATGDRRAWAILFDREAARTPGSSPSQLFGALLAQLPEAFRRKDVALGLSSCDLACDDVWKAPVGLRAKDLAAVAPVLVESRATGETLELLSIDVRLAAGQLAAVALATETLLKLRETANSRGTRLGLITSLPAAVADVFARAGSAAIDWAGQRIDVERKDAELAWRSVPSDAVIEAPRAPLALEPGQAAALAAALADREAVPDALRGAPDAPRSFGERFRIPLRILAVAASLFLAAVGLFFQAEGRRFQSELAVAEEAERSLSKRHFSERTPVRGDLLPAVKDRLRDSGQGASSDAAIPSAFLFWVELGKYLPDVEALGLTLESLDVSPEGGRLSAAVAAVTGDALRNGALLEAKVNESSRLSARGDFEARERDVQVRLKMDYRSR